MKIYYASQSFYPHIGGVSTYLLNLCKQMVNIGNEVVEVHLRPSGEVNSEEIKGIKVLRVPRDPIDPNIMEQYSKFKEAVYSECHYSTKKGFSKPYDQMEGFLEFNKVNEYFGEGISNLLEQNHADIVHIHDFQLLFAYKFVPRGTPLILTWHIPFHEGMSKYLSNFLIKHLNEYDKVVFSSKEYSKAAVKAGLIKDKVEIIYPIANTELFKKMNVNKDAVRNKYNIPADAKVIMCVQRVDPKSGHEQLVKALPKVLKKVSNAVLVFVGAESLSNKLSNSRAKLFNKVTEMIKDLGIEKNVIFAGNIDYNILPELYNSVDLVALTSKNEGFGLAVTEGMACGNPIIGTKVGGIPIQVKDGKNGFLLEPGDYIGTAKAIIKILTDDNLREKMGEKSLEIVDENFKMEVGVENHVRLYTKVRQMKDEFNKLEYLVPSDIKAIIMDFDRTITDKPPKKEFDANDIDKDLMKEMKKIDIDMILSTGRRIQYVRKLCKRFKVWRCAVAENGAVIYFPKTRKTITFNTFYMTKAKRFICEMNLPETTIGKVIASIKSEHEDKVREKLGKYADNVDFIRNTDEIMVVPQGVDKGVGIRLATRYMNIDLNNTIVVGDGENDVELFLNPGFKIALKNSHEKLKELANQVMDKPSISGFKQILKTIKKN
ncbi:MAG: glycosyltransferase [Nanoarchaeota archaeon]|nr:glycosyltransferase [Nanoarchaeota archaeon]MBU1850627.1 glycosyltransferase [Nanoarchaeota archaeon]